MELDLLRSFVAIVDQGSLTRAATTLNRTQSAVSMQLRRLEERVGTVLLTRGRVGVALTPAGEGLIGHARRMLALEADALAGLRAHGTEGRVRLGAMEDYGAALMPDVLARFAAAFPRIRVELETGLTAGMPERVGRDFDLAVVMHPAGEGGGTLLRREAALWVGAAGWADPAPEPVALALHPQGCLFRQWALAALDAAGRSWRLAFVSHSPAAVEAVLRRGLAVGVAKAGIFPAGLGRPDGLPALPAADIRLHAAPGIGPAARLLAGHIAAAFGQPLS
ncbi:MAG: LysR family transcriptional regulator [Alphaproteobacteria bacterium]